MALQGLWTTSPALCPTNLVIKFGDLMDPDAAVAKAQADSRSYELLGELNIKPRTKYLARVYNAVDGERYPDAFHGHGHGHGDSHHGDDSHGEGHH